MLLEQLVLTDFRNYAALDFAPARGLNVFVGPNAQGKSNLLEAIAMLATGKSFRATRESETIRTGTMHAEISGVARIAAGTIRLRCAIDVAGNGARKKYDVNGASVGFARFLGRARVVTFVPADLALVSGAPTLRRSFLNAALAQESPAYYRALARYQKVSAQKSALLRGLVEPDAELLAAYDESLAENGATIIFARAAFVRELAEAAERIYERWEGAGDRLAIRYAPNVPLEDGAELQIGTIRAAMLARLELRRPSELVRRTTLVGPHRDDLSLSIDGVPLAAFGSQGQQRTAVLALKVGEYDVMHARSGDAPILLLDDVLSELDPERAAGFLGALEGFEQAFLTTTDAPPLDPGVHAYAVRAATVSAL